jgi:hypothetical protein
MNLLQDGSAGKQVAKKRIRPYVATKRHYGLKTATERAKVL